MSPVFSRLLASRWRLIGVTSVAASATVASYFYVSAKDEKPSVFRAAFMNDARRPLDPEPGHEARTDRLRQQFSIDQLPSKVDAIVIGSGIGGLSTAAILSKMGRKVVVLERHWRAGGRCSSFMTGDGYEFDVGIHYVGRMGAANFERFLLDQITEGQVNWKKLPDDFDHVVYTKPTSGERVIVPIWEDAPRFLNEFVKRYPQHEKGLQEFVASMVRNGSSTDEEFWPMIKLVPMWMANAITKLGIYKFLTKTVSGYRDITSKEELDRLFGKEDSELKGIIGYCYGNGHVLPATSGREMLYALYSHFLDGSYFPVGGGNKIPFSLIGTIEKAGGRVLVDAEVSEILLDGGNKVTGVRVQTNSGPVDIKAPLVISNVGVANTFRKLLPQNVASKTTLGKLLDSGRIHPGGAFFKVYIGLKGSQAELKLPARNYWFIYGENYDQVQDQWNSLGFKNAAENRGILPGLFVNFASAKDPSYNDRSPGISVCEIITTIPVGWFDKWQDQPARNRDDDYQTAKMQLARRCWEQVLLIHPELRDKVDFMDAATPLTFKSFLNAYGGEPYGLDHDGERFSADVQAALRPKIPEIEGLFLTGQDMLMCGITAGLMSGYLTCQAILQSIGDSCNVFRTMEQKLKEFGPNKTAPQLSASKN